MAAKVRARAEPVQTVKPSDPELVEVTAVHPYQIGYEGQVVGPGESLDVPAELADQWVASGIASR